MTWEELAQLGDEMREWFRTWQNFETEEGYARNRSEDARKRFIELWDRWVVEMQKRLEAKE